MSSVELEQTLASVLPVQRRGSRAVVAGVQLTEGFAFNGLLLETFWTL